MHHMLDHMPQVLRDFVGPIKRVDVPHQGDASDVAIVTGKHGRFVVKLATKPPFHEWLRREYEVLCSLSAIQVPVPKALQYAEADAAEGHLGWLLMEYVAGIPLRVQLRHETDSAARPSRHRLLFQFGQTLASIHRGPVPKELLSGEPWLDWMLQCAAKHLRNYQVDGDSDLLHRLVAERPDPVQPCLIHGDYALDNILVSDGKVTGVIDWGWAACGDPRFDLAIATHRKPEAFGGAADFDAFYDGYSGRRLAKEEEEYFVRLYEFF